jgi:hypothetical protein
MLVLSIALPQLDSMNGRAAVSLALTCHPIVRTGWVVGSGWKVEIMFFSNGAAWLPYLLPNKYRHQRVQHILKKDASRRWHVKESAST